MSLTLAFRGFATDVANRRGHSRSRCALDTLPPRTRRWHVHLPRSARTDADSIEGASADYCDDFVCKSSPAVEQTVRAIAKNLKRANSWSPRFQPDVKYSDGMRKFRGAEVMMKRHFWVKENVTDYKVTIQSMKMLSKGTAEIRWQLRGSIGLFEIDVLFTTTITMNLLSGRLTEMSDSWNLEKCSPPGRAAFLASRSAWAARQASSDAAEGIQSSLDSLSSWDDDNSPSYSEDPTDPTKFFQGGGADKNADLFLGAAVIGVLWVFALAYIELSKL